MTIDLTNFGLPSLRSVLQSGAENKSEAEVYWDVKFWPYDNDVTAKPIFAVTNKKVVHIYSISSTSQCDVLRTFQVQSGQDFVDPFVACTWAYIDREEPLICAAGDSGLVRVLNVLQGDLKTTLQGHGVGNVNDLATHPIYPWIVASGSQDTSIRIWDLRRWNARHESVCIIICGHGHGHQNGILSLSWHSNGRYLISGGHDHRICIWTIPDLAKDSTFWDEISPEKRKRSSNEVKIIYYPHFTSTAMHSNFVDCVRFYGDAVLSKSAQENKIVLWRINGFDSRLPPPSKDLAPKAQEHLDSRNGFMRTHDVLPNGINRFDTKDELSDEAAFTRLLEFDAPNCVSFYMRFEILQPSPIFADLHPVLAIANEVSQLLIWDLEALSRGYNGTQARPIKPKPPPKASRKGVAHKITGNRSTYTPDTSTAGQNTPTASSPDQSPRLTASTEPTPPIDLFGLNGAEPVVDRKRFPLHDPHTPIEAHKVIQLKPKGTKGYDDYKMIGRSVAWSRDGKWCVAAGETQEAVGKWAPYQKGKLRERKAKQIGIASVLGRWDAAE